MISRLARTVGRVHLDALLDEARRSLQRLTPTQALRAQQHGALLIDTRTEDQRREQGELPGAIVIDRTVLEWRLDPLGANRIAEASAQATVIVVCRQGYSSSLAAASLQRIGVAGATDMIGGVQAWLEDGLPVNAGPTDIRR